MDMTLFILAFAMAFPAGAGVVRLLASPQAGRPRGRSIGQLAD